MQFQMLCIIIIKLITNKLNKMSDKKQTAVEWLVEQYTQGNYSWEVYDKAKEMEKRQIIDAYDQGDIQLVNGNQYYEQTYGGNNDNTRTHHDK